LGIQPAGAEGAKKINAAQLNSYLMCPPVQAIAAAADGDPHRPQNHNPGWDDVDVPLGPQGALRCLIPSLYVQMSQIQAEFDNCKSHKERADNQLIQALGGLKAMEWRIFHGVLLLASLPVDCNNILMADEPPVLTRWSGFDVAQLPFFQSTEFQNIMSKVHASQKRHANLLHLQVSPHNQNLIQTEIGDRILPGMQSQTRLCNDIIESQRRSEAELRDIKTLLLHVFQNRTNEDSQLVADNQNQNQNRVDSQLSFPFNATSNCTTSMALSAIPHNPLVCQDGLPRQRKPHKRVVTGPFSKQNITAIDYWNEYYDGVNGGEPLCDREIREGCKWRSDKTWGTGGTSLKASWSLQKPLYDFMEYLKANAQQRDDAVTTIQLIFNQQAYKSGKPDLGSCKKVFKLIMEGDASAEYVGERRKPAQSKKRKATP
jgi:hypothetical protein